MRCSSAAAVLAGGLMFSGPAAGSFIQVVEDFEDPGGAFFGGTGGSYGSYASTSFDFFPNPSHTAALGGTGGDFFGHTIDVESPVVSDAFAIPAGFLLISTEAWLASWTGDGDYTIIWLEFFSDSEGALSMGGPVVALDGSVTNGDPDWTEDNWSFYQNSVEVPVGAASLRILYGGQGNDTYADNIVVGVPEPGTAVLLGMAGLWLVRRRRC